MMNFTLFFSYGAKKQSRFKNMNLKLTGGQIIMRFEIDSFICVVIALTLKRKANANVFLIGHFFFWFYVSLYLNSLQRK